MLVRLPVHFPMLPGWYLYSHPSRGLAGPYVSDKLGDMFGFKPTDADKEALERIKPRIQVIERGGSN